jgi:3',5'-cyclic AMP phosphodiesterase CpdA
MQRRTFLQSALQTAVAAPFALGAASAAGAPITTMESFSFIHFTDSHTQPELRAGVGTTQAFRAIAKIPHDFALAGGDLVMDVFDQGPARATALFDLYRTAAKDLPRPVHSILGNHDIYGISNKSGVASSDPMYAKKLFEDRMGQPRYQSFDHKGWHFFLLDSVQIGPEKNWFGQIDDEQLGWLASDLRKTGKQTPIVALTHMPLASATGQFFGGKPEDLRTLLISNPRAVLDLFEGYKLKAVLQGHTHIREVVDYNGCRFVTPGAVCGNWWKGAFKGSPEGFGVLTVKGENISWEFRSYGWHAV